MDELYAYGVGRFALEDTLRAKSEEGVALLKYGEDTFCVRNRSILTIAGDSFVHVNDLSNAVWLLLKPKTIAVDLEENEPIPSYIPHLIYHLKDFLRIIQGIKGDNGYSFYSFRKINLKTAEKYKNHDINILNATSDLCEKEGLAKLEELANSGAVMYSHKENELGLLREEYRFAPYGEEPCSRRDNMKHIINNSDLSKPFFPFQPIGKFNDIFLPVEEEYRRVGVMNGDMYSARYNPTSDRFVITNFRVELLSHLFKSKSKKKTKKK